MGGPGLVDGYPLMCTDNFHVCDFKVEGKSYSTSQGYFQASKAINQADHEKIRKISHGITAWSQGSSIQLRPDWEIIKVRIMYIANKEKFTQNKQQKDQLISTKGEITFSSGFWGKWNGLILQRVRAQL